MNHVLSKENHVKTIYIVYETIIKILSDFEFRNSDGDVQNVTTTLYILLQVGCEVKLIGDRITVTRWTKSVAWLGKL